jgi:hypothetical protein
MTDASRCKTCTHRERAAIELALARGVRCGSATFCRSIRSTGPVRLTCRQLRAQLLAGAVDLGSIVSTRSAKIKIKACWLTLSPSVAGSSAPSTLRKRMVMVARCRASLGGYIRALSLTRKLVGSLSTGHTNVTNVAYVSGLSRTEGEPRKRTATLP